MDRDDDRFAKQGGEDQSPKLSRVFLQGKVLVHMTMHTCWCTRTSHLVYNLFVFLIESTSIGAARTTFLL
jgi:hypothetical protein